jgi:hypothetical protein
MHAFCRNKMRKMLIGGTKKNANMSRVCMSARPKGTDLEVQQLAVGTDNPLTAAVKDIFRLAIMNRCHE